ncbi:MAG: hypothetical protein ACE5JG_07660 [Planctomycetota bacterium]
MVAIGILYVAGRIGYLANAATLPPFRGRGCHTALLRFRIARAAREGCELVASDTEPYSASQRHMERAGLRLAYQKARWAQPRRQDGFGASATGRSQRGSWMGSQVGWGGAPAASGRPTGGAAALRSSLICALREASARERWTVCSSKLRSSVVRVSFRSSSARRRSSSLRARAAKMSTMARSRAVPRIGRTSMTPMWPRTRSSVSRSGRPR